MPDFRLKKLVYRLRIMRRIFYHPLHRGRRVAAVVNFLLLSIAKKLVPTHQIAIPYINGSILHWPQGATSVMICARYGLGEYSDMAFCLHLLRQEDTFCDVGANAGVYTVLAASAVGCRVIAIEPVPRTFDLLMQNVHANGISDKVKAYRCGIGQAAGKLFFTTSLWSYNHVVEKAGADVMEVDVATLDSVLAGQVPVAIKIDVEGFETKVLQGAKEVLADPRLQAVIIEMADHVGRYGDNLEDVQEILRSAGLSGPWWYSPENRALIAPGESEPTKFNRIFVRDRDWIASRLHTAARYEVHGAFV